MKKLFFVLLASCVLVTSCDHCDRVKTKETKANILVMKNVSANSTFIVDIDTIVSWLETEKRNISAFDVGYSVHVFPNNRKDEKIILICNEKTDIECLYFEQGKEMFFSVNQSDFSFLNYKFKKKLAELADYNPNFIGE